MDQSIKIMTPELWQEHGGDAYDQGLGVNDHGLPLGSQARRDWEFGWHTRRIERAQMRENQFTDVGNMVAQRLEEAV